MKNNTLKKSLQVGGLATLVAAGLTFSNFEYRQIARAKCNTELSISNSNDICEIGKNYHVKIIDRNGNELTLGVVIDGNYIEGTAQSKDFYIVDISKDLWEKLDMNYVAYDPAPEHHPIDSVNIRSTPKYDLTSNNIIDSIQLGDNVFGSKEKIENLEEQNDYEEIVYESNGVIITEPYDPTLFVDCWYINPDSELVKAYIAKAYIDSYEYSGHSISDLGKESTDSNESNDLEY